MQPVDHLRTDRLDYIKVTLLIMLSKIIANRGGALLWIKLLVTPYNCSVSQMDTRQLHKEDRPRED